MGKRSTSRKIAMQALYQIDVAKIPYDEAFRNIISEQEFIDETKSYAHKLLKGVIDNISEIDLEVSKYSKKWPLDRMSIVDRNIIRLAVYELMFEKKTPVAVIVDEAVELAKKYSSEEAKSFINGILSAIVKNNGKIKVCSQE